MVGAGDGFRHDLLNLPALRRKCPGNDTKDDVMNTRALALAALSLATVSLIAAPAEARTRHHHAYKATKARACVDAPAQFTWGGAFWKGKPQPNGCAPAVIEYGQYVGQDPDANVRLQLRRDPDNGFTNNMK
jgi:hypothetical protein